MLRFAAGRTITTCLRTNATRLPNLNIRRLSTQKPKMDRMNKEDVFITLYIGTGALLGIPASVKTGAQILSDMDDFPLAIPCAAIIGGLTFATVVVAYPLLLPMYYVSKNSNKK
jgi:hypothetical protein